MTTEQQIQAMRNVASHVEVGLLKAKQAALLSTTLFSSVAIQGYRGQIEGMLHCVRTLAYSDNSADAAMWAAFEGELIELLKQS